MSHIIITDDNGNEIGRLEHPPENPDGGRIEEPDHEAITLTLNRKYLRELMCDAIRHCDKHDKEKK